MSRISLAEITEDAEVRAKILRERLAKAAAERRRAISLRPVVVELTEPERKVAEKAAKAGDIAELRRIEAQAKARAEDTSVFVGARETIELERDRGEEIITPKQGRGEGHKPAKRVPKLDGLDVLKPKLTDKQFNAGRRFEAYYRATHRSDTKSCLNVMEGGTGVRYAASEAITYARSRLKLAAEELDHHAGMWQALEKVCGEGQRPAEVNPNRRAYERVEANLDCALSILVKLWGL